MKFYIASGFQNKDAVVYVSSKLKSLGYVHTYDWTQNERASSLESLREIGEYERDAVFNSDFVVILLPGGKGTHIELGMAIGKGKKIFLHSPDKEVSNLETTSTFYHIPEVMICDGPLDQLVHHIHETFNRTE